MHLAGKSGEPDKNKDFIDKNLSEEEKKYIYKNNKGNIIFTPVYKQYNKYFFETIAANTSLKSDFEAFRDTSVYERYMLNAAQFSAAKSAAESKMLQSAIYNEDKTIKSYSQFAKDAQEITDISQKTWLRVEYEMCKRQTVQSEAFRQMQTDADLYPFWIYKGMMDDREREDHVEMEGQVFRIGDPAGDSCFPPNDWNCRCDGESADGDEIDEKGLSVNNNEQAKGFLDSDVDDQFRYNPAVQGPMPNNGSYFDATASANELNHTNFSPVDLGTDAVQTEISNTLTLDEAKETMKDYEVDEETMKAIGRYTSGGYKPINTGLRSGETLSIGRQKVVALLDKFLEQAPKVETTSYRGVKLTSAEFKKLSSLKEGDIFTDKAFMSTSYDREITENFNTHSDYRGEYIIRGKTGVLVEYQSDISTEREILFGRGSVFKISHVEIEDSNPYVTPKIIVTLVEQ